VSQRRIGQRSDVASLSGLDAVRVKHKGARRIAPIGAKRHRAGDVEAVVILPADADADALAGDRSRSAHVHERRATSRIGMPR